MSDVTATEPVIDAPEPAPEPEVAPEAPEVEGQEPTLEVEAPELDPSEVQPDPAEALPLPDQDTVEVELNGLKYRVPAALKDGYLMNADYTLKTQELASEGRTLKSDREAFTQQVQSHRGNIQDLGALAHTEKLLEGFRKVDFQKLQQDDPDQAQQLGFQYQSLRDERQQIVERIQGREYDTRVTAERDHANRKNQLTATLARDIPDYSPETQTKMNETAFRSGFTQAEIDTVVDPRMMRVLHLANLGEQVLQRKRTATAQPVPKPVKPVPKVSGGRAPTTGPTDKQGMKDWVNSRRQQIERGTG